MFPGNIAHLLYYAYLIIWQGFHLGGKKKSYDKDFQYILRIHGTSLLHSLLDHLTVQHLVISCNMFTYKMLSFLVLDKQNVNVYPSVLKLKGEVFDYRHQIILFLRNQDVLFYNKGIFFFFLAT